MRATILIALLLSAASQAKPQENSKVSPVLNFTMNSLDGKPINLSKYQGNVVLMVNVASQCGYTPQYEGLLELHKRYAGRGLACWDSPRMISVSRNRGATPRLPTSARKITAFS